MSNIKGFQPITLIDYPDEVASIIFLGGCNLRCSFCHNPELVLSPGKIPTLDLDKILDFLKKRNNLLDGVVITGGEPCLNNDLPELISKIKDLGLKVKLDTNGTRPHMLEKVIHLVDFVAMDIKSSPENYSQASGVKVNIDDIRTSVGLIQEHAKDYEFRTTLVRELVSVDDIEEICTWLDGSKKLSLQQLNKKGPILDTKVKESFLYTPEQLDIFAEKCRPYFKKVEVRNL